MDYLHFVTIAMFPVMTAAVDYIFYRMLGGGLDGYFLEIIPVSPIHGIRFSQ